MSNDQIPNKILVVDEDRSVQNAIENHLTTHKVQVLKAFDVETALYLFNQHRFEVVLIELGFSSLSGLAFLQKWRAHEVHEKRAVGVGLIVGQKWGAGEEELLKELGQVEILRKPIKLPQLLACLSKSKYARNLALKKQTKMAAIENLIKAGKYEIGISALEKSLDILGENGYRTLFDLYEKVGRPECAIKLIDEILAKSPNNIRFINEKGRILMKMGEFEKASKYFEKADKVAPKNIERLNDLATLYLKLKRPDESVTKFKELLDLNPENPDNKFDMFAQLYDHGFDEQAAQFGKDTTPPMEIIRHYNNKGVLLSKSGDLEGAIEEYERALKFYPKYKENYRIHYNIALAMLNMKTAEANEQAKLHLEKSLILSPKFEKAKKYLVTVAKRLNPPAKAG